MAAIAEFERERIRERVSAGLDRARAEGKTLGRPKKYKADTAKLVASMHSKGSGPSLIARTLGIERTMVYRILKDIQDDSPTDAATR